MDVPYEKLDTYFLIIVAVGWFGFAVGMNICRKDNNQDKD